MQKLYIFIISGLLTICLNNEAYAQPGTGAMYIGDYSKMSSKQTIDQDMEKGNWVYRLQNLKNSKYNFTVTMKDNSVKQVHSKIYADDLNNKSYLLDAESHQKIYCDQTLNINRTGKSGDAEGLPTDSCWLFKVVSGPVNAFSFLPETDGPYSIIAIQMNGDNIINFDSQLLEHKISNNPDAMKAFLKKDYLKAIEKYNIINK